MRFRMFPIGLALFAPCGMAEAQDLNATTPSIAPQIGSLFARNRSTAVTERGMTGFERSGIDIGALNIRPEVQATAFYSDNIYATETNRTSDVALVVTPQVNAVLDQTYTRVTFGGMAQFSRYLSHGAESANTFGAQGGAFHDFGGGLTAGLNGGYRRLVEQRADPGAVYTSVKPIVFNTLSGGGEVGWEGNRVRLQAVGSVSHITYHDGQLADGTVIPQGYRDHTVYRANGTVDYALSANLALRFRTNYARSSFNSTAPFAPANLSSRRLEFLGGASFEFTDMLRGDIGLGYITETYDSPVFRPFSGFGGRAQIEYLVSRLTTITFRASRTIEESGLPQAPTYLHTTATLGVDHELFRNVVLSAYGGYTTNSFRQPSRSDHRPAFGVSGLYRLNRNVALVARYDYLDVSAHPYNLGRNLTLNAVSVGVNIGI